MLDTELLEGVGIHFDPLSIFYQLLPNAKVRLFQRDASHRVMPCLRHIEGALSWNHHFLPIMHISKVATVSQLGLEKLVITIKLSLDGEIRFYSGHLTQWLDVDGLESFVKHIWCAICEHVFVVFERWARHYGHMTSVALLDDTKDSIYVGGKNPDRLCLPKYVLHGVPVEHFGHAQEAFLKLCVKHLSCVNWDKWAYMWIHLWHNESVYIEELCQSLHG